MPTADLAETQSADVVTFLVARMRRRGCHGERCTGISSDALAAFGALGDVEPTLGQYPADPADLKACERTYLMAPDEARVRMLPVLERFRAHVADRWPSGGPGAPSAAGVLAGAHPADG